MKWLNSKQKKFLASRIAKGFERNLESREGRTLENEVLALMCSFLEEAFSLLFSPSLQRGLLPPSILLLRPTFSGKSIKI